MLTDKALQFQQKYLKKVSLDIEAEICRLKKVFEANFNIEIFLPNKKDE